MYFQQFYLGCLSHASYLIGSGGIAAVVDPQRDVGIYLEDAVKHGLRIAHVIETHLHADFISGHQELATLTGATIYLGAKAGAGFPLGFPRSGRLLRHSDFDRVYKQGRRQFSSHMTVFYLRQAEGGARIGFTVGKVLGGAVVRIGDTIYAGSLRSRLNEMRARLAAE